MLKITTLLFCTIFSTLAFGQTNYEKFKTLYKTSDTVKIKALLADWENTNPNDPELYTSAINFYFSNSKEEIISVNTEEVSQNGFQLTDSAGKIIASLNSGLGYNPNKIFKAIQYANTGIAKFPNRLDIRFGKCYLLKQIGDYENFTKELITIIEYSQVNKNNWVWTQNVKQENGEKFLVETIQTYLKELYDTENDNLLPNMIQIGEATLKYYPNSIELLSTTSVALLLTKNYDQAIEYLKQAEQLNPQDFIVLNNIAQGYKLKGDKANAIKYYELTERYGDQQAKLQARQNIEELKK